MFRFRRPFISIVAAAGIAGLAGCVAVPEGVTPVTGFDADRYLGTWYEIVRLDHRFERGLSNVTANYSYNDDGSIRVLNRGFETATCSYDEREGRATFVGDPSTASLGVSFFGPFEGGYHVIELGPNYNYAVVSGPTKGFLWVLSRTPSLPASVLHQIIADVETAGYPTEQLIFVDHDEPDC